MTRKLFLATVLMLGLLIVGCSSKSATNPTSNSNSNITSTVEDNSNNTSPSETKPKEEEKEKDKDTTSAEKVNKVELSIYNQDANTMEIKEIAKIEVNENLSLEDKLKKLGQALSEKVFDKLPIELKSIDTIDGKKIATINLKDNGDSKWTLKFQGSTGGQMTSDSLLETFLQVKYSGEWIDGVKFLYNGELIEYDHVSALSEIQTRN